MKGDKGDSANRKERNNNNNTLGKKHVANKPNAIGYRKARVEKSPNTRKKTRARPKKTKDETISLLKTISKVERLLGKSFKKAWRGTLSVAIIKKCQVPNFFPGHSYSFGDDYKMTMMFLMMLSHQSFLVRILYEFNQLLGVRDEALYGKYRDLCVRIWACAPSLPKLDPVSQLGMFKVISSSFEIATDEELRHILDLNIDMNGHGVTGNLDIQKLRPHIIQMGEKFTGRQELKTDEIRA